MKRNLLKLLVILVFAGLIINCSESGRKGYKKHDTGFFYKVHDEHSDAKEVNIGDKMSVHMKYYTKDSILFDSRDRNQVMVLELREPQYEGDIYEALSTMHEGDSTTFIVNIDSFFTVTNPAPVDLDFVNPDDRDLYFDIKLMKTQSKEEFEQEVQQKQQAMMSKNQEAEKKFFAENASKQGVKTTESGLQYKVIKEGRGKRPKEDSEVKVHYTGTLLDGQVFDSSVQRGQPATFKVNQVIPGWTEVLQLMKEGSVYEVFIPNKLAYGQRQSGPMIEPGMPLIFNVELLEVK